MALAALEHARWLARLTPWQKGVYEQMQASLLYGDGRQAAHRYFGEWPRYAAIARTALPEIATHVEPDASKYWNQPNELLNDLRYIGVDLARGE